MAQVQISAQEDLSQESGGRPDYSGCRLLRNVWLASVTLLGRVSPVRSRGKANWVRFIRVPAGTRSRVDTAPLYVRSQAD